MHYQRFIMSGVEEYKFYTLKLCCIYTRSEVFTPDYNREQRKYRYVTIKTVSEIKRFEGLFVEISCLNVEISLPCSENNAQYALLVPLVTGRFKGNNFVFSGRFGMIKGFISVFDNIREHCTVSRPGSNANGDGNVDFQAPC